jgi:chromosomal replication initiation ATPase DnaA
VSITVLSASPSQLDDPRWTAARANVAKHATPTEFNTWIEPLVVLDVIGETIILGAPNVFVRDEVAKAYLSSITDALATEFGRAMQVEVVIGTARIA